MMISHADVLNITRGLKYLTFSLKILVKKWLMVHTLKILEKENECSITQQNMDLYMKMSQSSQCINFLL